MTRVRFLESTSDYGKGACVTIEDAPAKKLIGKGTAVAVPVEELPSEPKREPMLRVRFVRDAGEKYPHYKAGAAAYLKEAQARAFIKNCVAREFPFDVDNKMVEVARTK